MDLQAASRLAGTSSQVAKIAALVCFALACGILIASHARASAGGAASAVQLSQISAAR